MCRPNTAASAFVTCKLAHVKRNASETFAAGRECLDLFGGHLKILSNHSSSDFIDMYSRSEIIDTKSVPFLHAVM